MSDLGLISCSGFDCVCRDKFQIEFRWSQCPETCVPIINGPFDCPVESFAFSHHVKKKITALLVNILIFGQFSI